MVKQKFDISVVANTIISLLKDAKALLGNQYMLKDFELDQETVIKRLYCEGLSFATRTLPNLSKGLLAQLSGLEPAYDGFKTCRHGYPCFLKGLFRLATSDNDCQEKIDAIRLIYQIGDGFKKLKGPFVERELENQLNEFIQTDQSLNITIDVDDPILVLARSYVTTIFKSVDDTFKDSLIPSPGPGATNDPLKLTQRFRVNKIFKSLDEVFNTQEWFYPTYWEGSWDRARLIALYNKALDAPSSRFKFVPKKVGTARGICIEFNEMQYLQQALKRFFYKHLERHWLTAGVINFTFQKFNQDLARQASIDGEHATLDMKDGSNRILRNIVSFLFSDLPNLSEALSVLSTRKITFDGVIAGKSFPPLETNMFAPMGSGICFPIMSITHFAIIKAIQTLVYNAPHDHFLVYGDDIIVKSSYVQALFDIMPKYGMKFNVNKSFFTGKFRESCGLHVYAGVDVTPIYFKYMFHSNNPKAVMGIIENEALAYQKGYYSLAKCIRDNQPKINLLVGMQSNLVGWKRPIFEPIPLNGYACKVRWSLDWQRSQRRLRTFHVEKFGSTPRMPRSWVHTVLTREQMNSLQRGTNWHESEAYMRSLLVCAENHSYHWDNTGIIKYRHSWV